MKSKIKLLEKLELRFEEAKLNYLVDLYSVLDIWCMGGVVPSPPEVLKAYYHKIEMLKQILKKEGVCFPSEKDKKCTNFLENPKKTKPQ